MTYAPVHWKQSIITGFYSVATHLCSSVPPSATKVRVLSVKCFTSELHTKAPVLTEQFASSDGDYYVDFVKFLLKFMQECCREQGK